MAESGCNLNAESTKSIVDLVYPVGSYYWSSNATNPSELFGGTWEQIKDRFVLAAGDNYSVGSSGGSASHSHPLGANGAACIGNYYDTLAFSSGDISWKTYNNGNNMWSFSHNGDTPVTPSTAHYDSGTFVKLTGTTDDANNMPPYITAYCFHRTA